MIIMNRFKSKSRKARSKVINLSIGTQEEPIMQILDWEMKDNACFANLAKKDMDIFITVKNDIYRAVIKIKDQEIKDFSWKGYLSFQQKVENILGFYVNFPTRYMLNDIKGIGEHINV